MDIKPEIISRLSDMIIVATFLTAVILSWTYFVCEFASIVIEQIKNILTKRKEKKEPDENRITEH